MILEEQIHAYQHSKVGGEAFNNAKLNYEIEAKLGWLQYEMRKGELYYVLNTYKNQFGGVDGVIGAESLIYSGAYKEFDISNKEYQKWYVDIIENLRKIHSYSEYSEQENCRNFVNIKELTEDCIESWEGMFY